MSRPFPPAGNYFNSLVWLAQRQAAQGYEAIEAARARAYGGEDDNSDEEQEFEKQLVEALAM